MCTSYTYTGDCARTYHAAALYHGASHHVRAQWLLATATVVGKGARPFILRSAGKLPKLCVTCEPKGPPTRHISRTADSFPIEMPRSAIFSPMFTLHEHDSRNHSARSNEEGWPHSHFKARNPKWCGSECRTCTCYLDARSRTAIRADALPQSPSSRSGFLSVKQLHTATDRPAPPAETLFLTRTPLRSSRVSPIMGRHAFACPCPGCPRADPLSADPWPRLRLSQR